MTGGRLAPVLLGWLAIATVAAWASEARGHQFEPYLLDLRERADGEFDALWREPSGVAGTGAANGPAHPVYPGDCVVIPREPAPGPGGTDAAVRAPTDPRTPPTRPHAPEATDDGQRSGRQTGPSPGTPDDAGQAGPADGRRSFARVRCAAGSLRGREISFVGAGAGGSSGDVIVRVHGRDGGVFTGVLRGGGDRLSIPASRGDVATPAAVLWRYVLLGVEHILTGWDHLLFVLGLVLLVGRGRRLLATITAFTLAHSITLALAALGVVHVPSPPVEAAIAVSIVLVAVEAAQPPGRPLTLGQQFPWAIAFLFGLLHGLGFAGALADVGLPDGQIPLALLAFNVGVELGQLGFVLALFPVMLLGRRLGARWPGLARVPVYAIGSIGAALAIERVLSFAVPAG